MRLLAFSDLHCDLEQAAVLVERSKDVDAVIGVGDFAVMHRHLEPTVDALSAIVRPMALVPGNNETEDALRAACTGWPAATVLHGEVADLTGVEVFGLGCGVPTTPWDWSFDLTEDEAAEKLEALPAGCVLASHSPPKGHADLAGSGIHLGSTAVLEAIERVAPRLVLCGHIHESWGTRSMIGDTEVLNLGPTGTVIDLP